MTASIENPATDSGLIGTIASLVGGLLALLAKHAWESARERKKSEMPKDQPERTELFRIAENTAKTAELLRQLVESQKDLSLDLRHIREAQIELRGAIQQVKDQMPLRTRPVN